MTGDSNGYSASGWGIEVDLSPETCSTECWAFLNRPDTEKHLKMDDWLIMYKKRIADGQGSEEI